jgi:hypothetical protein
MRHDESAKELAMTTQEAIAKAIEGGYTAYKLRDPSWPRPEQYLLDTSFWEALGPLHHPSNARQSS